MSLRTSRDEWETAGTPMGCQAPAPPRRAAHARTFTKTTDSGKYVRLNTSLIWRLAAS